MKVLLDIQDGKAIHLMEILNSLPYVKAQLLSDEKAELITEMKNAVSNLNEVLKGNQEARPVQDLLDEL